MKRALLGSLFQKQKRTLRSELFNNTPREELSVAESGQPSFARQDGTHFSSSESSDSGVDGSSSTKSLGLVSKVDFTQPSFSQIDSSLDSGGLRSQALNSGSQSTLNSSSDLESDLSECAKLGLDVADAHSCFILLPRALTHLTTRSFNAPSGQLQPSQSCDLALVAHHSLSVDIVDNAIVPLESGLIGWVGRHGKTIHVSPFDRDSRTLGVYKLDQELKSFIGIPFVVDEGRITKTPLYGVLACDSKKSFAFSRLQGKLLERVGDQIRRIISLHASSSVASDRQLSWSRFHSAALTLEQDLGIGAVDVLRVQLSNFSEIELQLGTESAVSLVEKLTRLVQQTIPENVPSVRLPDGSLLVALDTMMVSFYEGRIEAVAQHLAPRGCDIRISFSRGSKGVRKGSRRALSDLIAGTISNSTTSSNAPLAKASIGRVSDRGNLGKQDSSPETQTEFSELKRYEYG